MMCLFNAFVSGLCCGAALHCFITGNINFGLITLGLAIANITIAIINYINKRS